jgi:hypothetical protein
MTLAGRAAFAGCRVGRDPSGIDNLRGKREGNCAIGQSRTKRRKLDYPDDTNGTRWAAEARKLASKMTAEQRAEHFRRAIQQSPGFRRGRLIS